MHDDRHYSQENILIHEFGHSVMCIGMTDGQRQGVQTAYTAAKSRGLYHPSCYSMEVLPIPIPVPILLLQSAPQTHPHTHPHIHPASPWRSSPNPSCYSMEAQTAPLHCDSSVTSRMID